MDEQELTSELIIFLEGQQEEHYTIRKVWYDGRLYFSIVDIITAMQVSQRAPRQYWAQLKERVKDEGFPEAAFEQMVHQYIERGYEPDWAWTRAQGDLVCNELTDEWEDRGAKGPREFGILTGIMHKGAFDLLPSDHKSYKNIPQKENLRDHMTIAEQGVSIFTETIGISLHRKRDTQGFQGLQRDAHDAGRAGKQAREIAEATLGERVVSRENYLHLKKVKGKQQREQKRLKQGPQGSLFDEPD